MEETLTKGDYTGNLKMVIEMLKSPDVAARIRMSTYNEPHPECGSVGCVIGHSVELMDHEEMGRLYMDIYTHLGVYGEGLNDEHEEVFYRSFTKRYLIDPKSHSVKDYSSIWLFLFGSQWSDDANHAIERIEYFIEHGEVNKLTKPKPRRR